MRPHHRLRGGRVVGGEVSGGVAAGQSGRANRGGAGPSTRSPESSQASPFWGGLVGRAAGAGVALGRRAPKKGPTGNRSRGQAAGRWNPSSIDSRPLTVWTVCGAPSQEHHSPRTARSTRSGNAAPLHRGRETGRGALQLSWASALSASGHRGWAVGVAAEWQPTAQQRRRRSHDGMA